MLSIFLMILKVIGLLLLVILGLLLLSLLLLLFVPLRYKGESSYYGKPVGLIKLSWLFHIISVSFFYREELEIVIRFFGFRIRNRKKTAEDTEEAEDDAADFLEEPMVSVQEVKAPIKDPKEVPQIEEARAQKTKVPEQKVPEPKRSATQFFCRTLKAFLDKLRKVDDLRQKVTSAITNEENKKTLSLIIRQAKKIIRHICPKILKGNITFGFDDPYITGQVLTGAALFYPIYGAAFTLHPIFDQQIIEGEITFKGRIRLYAFVAVGLKILRNKNFRVQLKKIMNRGGM